MCVLGPASALWRVCSPQPASQPPTSTSKVKPEGTEKKKKKKDKNPVRFNLPSFAFVKKEMQAWRDRPSSQGLHSFVADRPYGKTAIEKMLNIEAFAVANNVDLDLVPSAGKRKVTVDHLKAWVLARDAAAPAATNA